MRRAIALALIVLVALPLALAQEPAQEDVGTNAMAQCSDLRTLPGVGPACARAGGVWEVYAPDGRSLGFTHGADMRTAAEPSTAAAGSESVHCVAGAPGEYYTHVIYARASDRADRFATMLPVIRDLVAQANAMVDDAAIATGDRLSLRVKCASGLVVVENEVLPTSRLAATFSTVVNDLQNKGYADDRQKYWVFYDGGAADCANCAGVGHVYDDDSDSVNNLHNGPSSAVPMFAVSFDSPEVRTMLHELAHTLGAVQDGAPRSSGGAHCTDGRDTMCYADGGPNSAQCADFLCTGTCAVEVFDCRKDTYCHANPPAGSYLDTHWQVCHRQSRFVQFGDNVAPTMTALSCSPSPSYVEDSITCSFSASDANVGVSYNVAWGDGATSRVPLSGTVAPGTTQTASHAYATAGERTIRVSATDTGTPAMTSAERTVAHTVLAGNTAPVVTIADCSPATPSVGAQISCSFSSADANGVSYQVDWGDGSASTRVPATGVVAPSATQTASHAYATPGTFVLTVTATDDGEPAKSGTATRTFTLAPVAAAPVMRTLTCSPGAVDPGELVSCSFNASDDGPLFYRVDWGDGTIDRVPTSSCAPAGAMRGRAHGYAAQGNYTIRVVATDCAATPSPSAPLVAAVRVDPDTTPPSLTLQDPRPGMLYVACGQQLPTLAAGPVFVSRGCVRADVRDVSGVARVEVLRGGVVVATDTLAPYQMDFELPAFELGATWTLRAVDAFGNARSVDFAADALRV